MRGATLNVRIFFIIIIFLLTHLMRGATFSSLARLRIISISTHTPHARCDMYNDDMIPILIDFYSHTSCEVRLHLLNLKHLRKQISTHTPHARCDKIFVLIYFFFRYFYSHTSCEVRQEMYI